MKHLNKLDDRMLIAIIKDEHSDEFDVEEAKEIIFKRYEYMPKYMLKKLRLKYSQSEETDLILHGNSLIVNAINSYDHINGCAFKTFVFYVIKKGILNQFFQKDKFRKNELPMTNVCDEYDFSTFDSLSNKSTDLKAYEILMLEEQVKSIKNHLSESEYNCIMARYFGASYKETAQTFGYTVKQVDNKIQSVRKDKTRFIKQTSI